MLSILFGVVVIGFVVAMGLGIDSIVNRKEGQRKHYKEIICFIVAGILFVPLLIFGSKIQESIGKYDMLPNEIRIEESIPLAALNDSMGIEGSYTGFFVRTGYIQDHLYYFVIKGTPEDGYKQEKIAADDNKVTVYEIDDPTKARIERGAAYRPEYDDGVIHKNESFIEESDFINIYVPKNTILRSYEIDAQ